jgi:hypothetical protein
VGEHLSTRDRHSGSVLNQAVHLCMLSEGLGEGADGQAEYSCKNS